MVMSEKEKKRMLSLASSSVASLLVFSLLWLSGASSDDSSGLKQLNKKQKTTNARARTFLASFFSSECDGIDDRSRSIATQSALASRFDASSWQALLAWTCSAVSSSSNPKWSTITFVGGGGMANVETSSFLPLSTSGDGKGVL